MSIKLLMRTNLWKISKSNALFLLKYMNMYVILASLNEQKKKREKRSKNFVTRIILLYKNQSVLVKNAFI